MLRAASHHPCRRYQPKTTPQVIFENSIEGFRSNLITLTIITAELYRSNISTSDNILTYPRGQAITYIDYFCDGVVNPVVDLLSDLRARRGWSTITFRKSSRTNGCSLVTLYPPRMDFKFISVDGERKCPPPVFPVVVVMPPFVLRGILDSAPECTAIILDLLEPVWKANPETQVVCCDLQNVLILKSQEGTQARDIICGHFPLPNLAAAKVILAAYLTRPLLRMGYLLEPELFESRGGVGPLHPLPSVPVLPDDMIFSHCCRHSDFDYPLIYTSEAHRNQFYRWKQYMFNTVKSYTLASGDMLQGTTNEFVRLNPLLRPYYPALLPPRATMEFFKKYRRPDPFLQFSSRFDRSSSFTIRIIKELSKDHSDGMPRPCRTYTCQLISTDNSPFSEHIPVLCLKLYDDRFLSLQSLRSWGAAEDMVRNEIAVYQKLDFMQGSMLPYFYGAHLFSTPSGLALYGILMEYIEAPTVSKNSIQVLSKTEQLQLIESVRHSVRVFQYADICQHDWHRNQILVRHKTNRHGESYAHCVLIDFGDCTQSLFPGDNHVTDDFRDSVLALASSEVLDHDTIAGVYGRRDPWDRRALGPWIPQEDLYYRPERPLLTLFGLTGME
ncbi:hypothetical protein QCA50_008059 [Cerrena zonata]|uniref:Protein kinase domain-containing protein n=1 Tax=Cerrena zonata TaxID=2478898 RepID=A0AAW0G5A0_9APHY